MAESLQEIELPLAHGRALTHVEPQRHEFQRGGFEDVDLPATLRVAMQAGTWRLGDWEWRRRGAAVRLAEFGFPWTGLWLDGNLLP